MEQSPEQEPKVTRVAADIEMSNSDRSDTERSDKSEGPAHVNELVSSPCQEVDPMSTERPATGALDVPTYVDCNSLETTLCNTRNIESTDVIVPRHVTIDHNLLSLNRKIEGHFQSYMFRFKGHVKVPDDCPIFTRQFEAIGDFIPNLIVGHNNQNRFFLPKQFLAWKGKCPEVSSKGVPPKDSVRYKLFCGKYIDVPRGRFKKEIPLLLNFPAHPQFGGCGVKGINVDATIADLEASEDIIEMTNAYDPQALFALAIERAKLNGRERPELVSYVLATEDHIGSSEDAKAYLSDTKDRRNYVSNYTVLSSLELITCLFRDCREFIEQQGNIDNARQTLLDFFDASLQAIEDGKVDEKGAEYVYNRISGRFSRWLVGDTPDFDYLVTTDLILDPNPELPSSEIVEVHMDGVPYYVDASIEGSYEFPKPYTIVPRGSSLPTMVVMAGFHSISDGLRLSYGEYTISGDIFPRSVTPRNPAPERGIGDHPIWWREKLKFNAHYKGPIARVRDKYEEFHRDYAVALNTCFLNDYVRRNSIPTCTELMRPRRPIMLPRERTGPYLDGIGFRDGALFLSPLVDPNWKWQDAPNNDARLHLPVKAATWLLSHPTQIRILDLESYLARECGLRLLLKDKDGNTREPITYEPDLVIDFDKPAADMVSKQTITPLHSDHVQKDKGKTSFVAADRPLELNSTGASSSQGRVATTPDTPDVIPAKVSDAWRPFNQMRTFGGTPRNYRPGEWKKLCDVLTFEGKVQNFKKLYTAHWDTANGVHKYEVCNYHHPKWADSLKETDPVSAWYDENIYTNLRVCPEMVIDDRGCLALNAKTEVSFLEARQQRTRGRNRGTSTRGRRIGVGRGYAPYVDQSMGHYNDPINSWAQHTDQYLPLSAPQSPSIISQASQIRKPPETMWD